MEGDSLKSKLDPFVWEDRLKRLDALRELVAKFIDDAREKQGRIHNKGRRVAIFEVGDSVMRKTHHLSNAAESFSAKLVLKLKGLFKILEKKSPNVYILGQEEGRSRKITKRAI